MLLRRLRAGCPSLSGRATVLIGLMVLLAAVHGPPSVDALAPRAPASRQLTSGESAMQEEAREALQLLVERLTVADDLMQQLREAASPSDSHVLARMILDQITGPSGRHAEASALSPGVLPADLEEATTDVGLGLTIFDATTSDQVRREISETILGDVAAWRRPADRWNEIDAVLAEWRPERNTMPRLDGHLMRVVGWCVLTLRSDSAKDARGYASHGRLHTGLSLEAARRALASDSH